MYCRVLRALMLALQYLCDLLQENPVSSLNLGMSLFKRNLSGYNIVFTLIKLDRLLVPHATL
jgi:hypothetical protein